MKIKPSQTRGRPRKNNSQDPQKQYFQKFSMNVEVVYQLSLMYVMQVFAQVKEDRRLAHFQSGFTIYDKQFPNYSFDTLQKNIIDWEVKGILENDQLKAFAKSLVSIGPTVVYKELILIINRFLQFSKKISSSNSLISLRYELIFQKDDVLNKKYPFLRFSSEKLRTLQFQCHEQINSKVKKLWQIFVYIYTYSIYKCFKGSNQNKFLLNLSTEAPQHMQTLMGHPNLEQVIQMVEPFLNNKIEKIRIRGYHLKMSETAACEHVQKEPKTGHSSNKYQQLNSSDSNQLDIQPQSPQFRRKNFQKEQQRQKFPPKQSQKKILDEQFYSDQIDNFHQKSISSKHQVSKSQQQKQNLKILQLIMANERDNFDNPITIDQITPYNQFNQNPRKRVKTSSITSNAQQTLKAFQTQSLQIWNSKKQQKIEKPTESTQSPNFEIFNLQPFDLKLVKNPKKFPIQTIIQPIKQLEKQQQYSKQK